MKKPAFLDATLLMGFFCAALILLSWGALGHQMAQDRERELQNALRETENLARAFQEHALRTVESVRSVLGALKDSYEKRGPGLLRPFDAVARAVVARHASENREAQADLFNLLSIADASGDLVLSSQIPFVSVNIAERPFFRAHRDGERGLLVGDPILGRATGKWYLPMSLPLEDPEGNFAGVVLASVNPFYFSDVYRQIRLGAGGCVLLLRAPGRVLAGIVEGSPSPFDTSVEGSALFLALRHEEEGSLMGMGLGDGVRRILSFRSVVPHRALAVAVGFAEGEVLEGYVRRRRGMAGGVLAFDLFVAGFFFVARRTLRRERETEERFRIFFEQNSVGFALTSAEGQWLHANDALCRMTGFSREELRRRTWQDLTPPEDREGELRFFQNLLAGTASDFSLEKRYVRRDDTRVDVAVSTRILRNADGGVRWLASIVQDISERKAVERALRTSEERQTDIVEFLPDAVVAVDARKRVILWNRAMEILSGIPAQEILGQGDYAYTVPFYGVRRPQLMDLVFDDSAEVAARYPFVTRAGKTLETEVFCPVLGGKGAWIYAKAAPLHDGQGRVIGAIEILRDVTPQRETAQLLVRRAEELERHRETIIHSMALLAEYRDQGTGAHIQRTKAYVRLLLERSGGAGHYPPEDFSLVWQSAALHDIGKVGVPDAILLKPGRLTPEEFAVIKTHPTLGSDVLRRAERLLGSASFVTYARDITEFHHEKWDGSGYPHGLAGEAIPFVARIMAIADVYDALVTARPYRAPMAHAEAVAIIRAGSGSHFDPHLVQVFLDAAESFAAIAREIREEASQETGRN